MESSNFEFLKDHEPIFLQLAMLAERSFVPDPNTTLVKLGQLCEALAQDIASRIGIYFDDQTKQIDLLRDIEDALNLNREIRQLFHGIRKLRNLATHEFRSDHKDALDALKLAWRLSIWYHRSIGKVNDFKPTPFQKPADPGERLREKELEMERLISEHQLAKEKLEKSEKLIEAEKKRAEEAEALAKEQAEQSQIWEALATEQEEITKKYQQQFEKHTHDTFANFQNVPQQAATEKRDIVKRINESTVDIDEAETRILIDQQFRDAGWTVDTEYLRYGKGARPQKGKYMAIAEWPTRSGPADYVLFDGLTALAVVEAKRRNTDVSASIDQAKRYSRDFQTHDACELPNGSWGEYQIPFTFSSNGKPYLNQLRMQSGVWFCDVRRSQNLRRPMDGWYSPEGLRELLKQDVDKAESKLDELDFEFDFKLRKYQEKAIKKIEKNIKEGGTTCLVAMATGTGKTKTTIALVYRLLQSQRFRRILFLVDRTALGVQAADSFKQTRMKNLQTFADTFNIKELQDKSAESDTDLQIATVQGLVKRILYSDDPSQPTVDEYDCIVVDECHRGYLLDRELSDTEMSFRDQDDYISKYRRVLDYFDAVKIGLTATPALHTTEIFGEPVYSYSYREAVIDGYLIDHEPPYQIKTQLSEDGITWKVGEEIEVYKPSENKIDLVHAPDEVNIEIEGFNKKVITEPFNRVVCEYLAQNIDPISEEKTLIFCATDKHADMVVALLKEAFQNVYGECDDDAVTKITGASDKPLELIRRYRNEKLPNVAVTVDLLTTGVDIRPICNLVFIRRVNSRILYEQMIGRATRICDEINKSVFRIYDAVDLYTNLAPVTSMKPVVTNPNITFTQLIEEITQQKTETNQQHACEQFIAKLQRKKHVMNEQAHTDFETYTGMSPDKFIEHLKQQSMQEIARWFTENSDLGEILERKGSGQAPVILISRHEDKLVDVERGYGRGQKPEDYIDSFKNYIKENSNKIPALLTVLQRPRELTRKELKTLMLELDRQGYTEKNLETAWYEMTNQDIAAKIVGFIRQAAIGDALVPWNQRVENALNKITASQKWTPVQRKWLDRIAAQMKMETIVDRESMDIGVFKSEGGGFNRINNIFDNHLEDVLNALNDALWEKPKAQ